MEQQMTSKKRSWVRSWWTRALAAFLALAMTGSVFLMNAAQIKLGAGGQSASTSVLNETTDYVQKSALSRAGDVLASIVMNPETLEQYYNNASVQIGEAKYDEALESIKACIPLVDGSNWSLLDELWLKRGALETLTGAYDDALESFTHITIGSYMGEQLLIKAQIFGEKGDERAVASMLHEYVRLYPDDMETRITLASAYVQLGEYDAAIEQYSVVIDAGGDADGASYMQRATARLMNGQYEASIEFAETDPAFADFRNIERISTAGDRVLPDA